MIVCKNKKLSSTICARENHFILWKNTLIQVAWNSLSVKLNCIFYISALQNIWLDQSLDRSEKLCVVWIACCRRYCSLFGYSYPGIQPWDWIHLRGMYSCHFYWPNVTRRIRYSQWVFTTCHKVMGSNMSYFSNISCLQVIPRTMFLIAKKLRKSGI